MPSVSPFICLVLSPSHSDFTPSSVWTAVTPTLLCSVAMWEFIQNLLLFNIKKCARCASPLKSHIMWHQTLVNIMKLVQAFELIGNIKITDAENHCWRQFPIKQHCSVQEQLEWFPLVIGGGTKMKRFEDIQISSWKSLTIIFDWFCIQLHILALIVSWGNSVGRSVLNEQIQDLQQTFIQFCVPQCQGLARCPPFIFVCFWCLHPCSPLNWSVKGEGSPLNYSLSQKSCEVMLVGTLDVPRIHHTFLDTGSVLQQLLMMQDSFIFILSSIVPCKCCRDYLFFG